MQSLFRFFLLCAGLLGSASHAATHTWTGAGDGKSFALASNWSPAVLPDSTSDCVIPAGATTVIFGGNPSVKSLSTARNMLIEGCTTVRLKEGLTLSGGAVITVNNTGGCSAFLFDGGTHTFSGTGQIFASSTGSSGPIVWLQHSASLTIESGITITYGPGSVGSSAVLYVNTGCSLINQGKIALTRPSGTLTVSGEGTFANTGIIEATTGTFQLQTASWSNSGTIQSTNSKLTFSGAWSNSGLISLVNSIWDVAGTYSDLGNVTRTGGTVHLGGTFTSSTLSATAATGDLDITGLTLSVSTLSASSGAKFLTTGNTFLNGCTLAATLNACGEVTVTGGLTFSGGVVSFANCSSGGVLRVTGGNQAFSGSGSVMMRGALLIEGATQLTLQNGVLFRDQSSSGIGIGIAAGCEFVNQSQLSKHYSGSFSITGEGRFTNSGSLLVTVDATSLTINCASWSNLNSITNAASQTVLSGQWSNEAGATLTVGGQSNVSGSWQNRGTLTASGTFAVPYNATWSNSGALIFNAATATLGGTSTNSGTFTATGGSLRLQDSWSNAGQITLNGTAFTADGTYPGIGLLTRSGAAAITLSGTCTTSLLEATPATGDLQLDNVHLTGCTLKASGGAKLLPTGAVFLTSCVLRTGLVLNQCASTLTVSTALTFADNAVLTIDRASDACGTALRFATPSTVFVGSGEIVVQSGERIVSLSDNQALTIWSNVTLRIAPGFTPSRASFSGGTGSQLTNRSKITLAQPGVTLTLGGTFKNLGTLEALAGILDVPALTGDIGKLTLGSAAVAKFSGNPYTVNTQPLLSPGAELQFSGTYTFGLPLSFSDAKITLFGNWKNNSALSAQRSQVTLSGTWTNAGSMDFSDSTVTFGGIWQNTGSMNISDTSLTLGGSYPSLGTHTFSNLQITLSGTLPPGMPLTADATTGDIRLSGAQLSNSALRATQGARILILGTESTRFSACTIEGDVVLQSCAPLEVSDGLTLVNGATIHFSNACYGGVQFVGGPQSVIGEGEFLAEGSGNDIAMLLSVYSDVTLTSGISVRVASGATGYGISKIYMANSSAHLINQGIIRLDADRDFYVVGYGHLNNQGIIEINAGTFRVYQMPIDNISNGTLNGGTWRATNAPIILDDQLIRRIGPDAKITLDGPSAVLAQLSKLESNAGTLSIRNKAMLIAPASPGVFTNTGTLDIGSNANISLTGSAAFGSSGSLRIEVAGLNSGQSGLFAATGPITLAGSLQGSFASPFTPADGDVTAPVIKSPQISGSFVAHCFDPNPFGLGVLPLFDAGPPNSISLEVSHIAGIPPQLVHGPATTSANPNVTFNVDAWPATLTYQWKRDGEILVDGPTQFGSIISGAATSELAILRAHPADRGEYTVTVSTPCASVTSEPAFLNFCHGDFNSDIIVDDADFGYFASNYNTMDCADPAMPRNCPGDFNYDGVVDDSDFLAFVGAYDALVCPQFTVCRCSTPEPTSPPCDFFVCQ